MRQPNVTSLNVFKIIPAWLEEIPQSVAIKQCDTESKFIIRLSIAHR